MTGPPKETAHLYSRDARRVRRLADEIIRQVDNFEANTAEGDDDRLRFLLFLRDGIHLMAVARRGWKRYQKEEHGTIMADHSLTFEEAHEALVRGHRDRVAQAMQEWSPTILGRMLSAVAAAKEQSYPNPHPNFDFGVASVVRAAGRREPRKKAASRS